MEVELAKKKSIWKTQDVVAIASPGRLQREVVVSVRYRFEIVVEVRCAISLSTGGIFTSRGADLSDVPKRQWRYFSGSSRLNVEMVDF